MIRRPYVAGQFYPSSPSDLQTMIESFTDDSTAKEDAVGMVLPHAGYIYSGPVTGAVISRVKLADTLVIIGPNHTGLGKPFSVMAEGTWQTPLGDVPVDSGLASQILSASSYLKDDSAAHQYEHSIEVQLPFLQHFKPDVKIVPVILAHSRGDIYKNIGRELAKAILESKKNVAIIASSDMSHYEPDEVARSKDSQAIEAILNLDEDELLRRVEGMNITMCGYAPVMCLITAARRLGGTRAELVKYQTSGDTSGDYSSVVGYAGAIIKKMSPITALARQAVETYVREGKIIPVPEQLTPEMKDKAGAFVSIHKFHNLRGCIGTFEPMRPNIAMEVITNAISSATRDPRFPPISPVELDDLTYSVDVLTKPEPVDSPDMLDPKKYGAIVQCGSRRGLLLPDLEGVDTVDYQINICCQKAGIGPDEPLNLYRFEVKRYK